MPTIYFHRGQTVVTQTLKKALEELGHDCFIHARMGAVYGINQQEKNRYGWGEATYWDDYDLKKNMGQFLNILKNQEIDLVLFNEEYDWELVGKVKESGFKVATYLDYLHKSWLPGQESKAEAYPTGQKVERPSFCAEGESPLSIYDLILCSTKRSYEMMPSEAKSQFIGWGIDEKELVQFPWKERPYLFFFNAGWLGINDRKGLGTLLGVYQKLLEKYPELRGSLLIQTQIGFDTKKQPELFDGVDIMQGSMCRPGLYHMAKVYCYPAKLDSLGLSLLEAIASGMAIICPDAPPWNEFVTHTRNGFLLPVSARRDREDGIAFPEVLVSENGLFEAMERLYVEQEELTERMSGASYAVWLTQLNWNGFKERIRSALESLESKPLVDELVGVPLPTMTSRI